MRSFRVGRVSDPSGIRRESRTLLTFKFITMNPNPPPSSSSGAKGKGSSSGELKADDLLAMMSQMSVDERHKAEIALMTPARISESSIKDFQDRIRASRPKYTEVLTRQPRSLDRGTRNICARLSKLSDSKRMAAFKNALSGAKGQTGVLVGFTNRKQKDTLLCMQHLSAYCLESDKPLSNAEIGWLSSNRTNAFEALQDWAVMLKIYISETKPAKVARPETDESKAVRSDLAKWQQLLNDFRESRADIEETIVRQVTLHNRYMQTVRRGNEASTDGLIPPPSSVADLEADFRTFTGESPEVISTHQTAATEEFEY